MSTETQNLYQTVSEIMKERDDLRARLALAVELPDEVYLEGNLDMGDTVSVELDNRISSYLDTERWEKHD